MEEVGDDEEGVTESELEGGAEEDAADEAGLLEGVSLETGVEEAGAGVDDDAESDVGVADWRALSCPGGDQESQYSFRTREETMYQERDGGEG